MKFHCLVLRLLFLFQERYSSRGIVPTSFQLHDQKRGERYSDDIQTENVMVKNEKRQTIV